EKNAKKLHTKTDWKAVSITTVIVFFLLLFGMYLAYESSYVKDRYCQTSHATSTSKPATPITAKDYFDLGNYNFDIGNFVQSITDYTKAIALNPQFSRAYNNRAYSYMRMQQYPQAIVDLNTAIALDPNYVIALMNRGDIYNYYFAINK